MLEIGGLTLNPGRPDKERLKLSGVTPERMQRMLSGHVIASTIAAALNATLDEPIDKVELARAIRREGLDTVRQKVLALYGEPVEVTVPAPANVEELVQTAPTTPKPQAKKRSRRGKTKGKSSTASH